MPQTSTLLITIHPYCGHGCPNSSSSSSVPQHTTHSNSPKDDTTILIKQSSRGYFYYGPRPSSAPSSPRPRPLPTPPIGPDGSIAQRPHSDIILEASRSLSKPVSFVCPRSLPRPGCQVRPLPVPPLARGQRKRSPSIPSAPSQCPSPSASLTPSPTPSPLPSPSPFPSPSLAIRIVNADGIESTEIEGAQTIPHDYDAVSPIVFLEHKHDDLLESKSHLHGTSSFSSCLNKSSAVIVRDSRVSGDDEPSSHPVEAQGKQHLRSRLVVPSALREWTLEKKGKRWTGKSTDFRVVLDALRKL